VLHDLRKDLYQMKRHERFEGLVSLDSVRPEDEAQILPDFPAEVDGQRVWVTAVLDRTAVVEPAPGEPKILVNRRLCMVDPSRLRFAPSAARYAARRGREAARRNRAGRGHAA
jgi:hypothetical protein